MTRRTNRGSSRRIDITPRKGFKDDAKTGRALDAINREYQAKERAALSGIGPPSTPAEQSYPKSFKLKPKKEG